MHRVCLQPFSANLIDFTGESLILSSSPVGCLGLSDA